MRALITGATGFVGRHMVEHLDRRGWDTVGIDVSDGVNAVDFFRYSTARYDLIVHAAASAPHRVAIDTEHAHMARNVQLDAALFDWAVRTGQGRALYLSSSAVYPSDLQGVSGVSRSLHEDDVRWNGPTVGNPESVYGWTKLTGERMAAEARKDGLAVTVVRPFSGYGEDQSENFPFRAMAERARRRDDPFVIWGDGDQVRDWIHIDDVVRGALAVVSAQVTLEADPVRPVNLCTGDGWSMTEVARLMCDRVGYKPTFEYRTDKPGGVPYRVGDPSWFHGYYRPRISLPQGIQRALK